MDSRKGRNFKLLTTSLVATLLATVTVMAATPAAPPASAPAVDQKGPTILQTYKGHFMIGTAADLPRGFSEQDLALVKENFDVVTPENCMKPQPTHPAEDQWNYGPPDALVKWCEDNKIKVHGHTLVWHSQTANWFFQGGDKAVITKRLQDHVKAVVGRYKGKIYSWDVVNEAINDGGGRGGAGGPTENLRNSSWLSSLGPEFLNIAFKAAHEADPECKLYYNDYNIETGAKHEASMVLLKRLIKDGVPIYGVGIQGHWSTNNLPYAAIDKAIANYGALGLKVTISELDVTINGTSGGQLNGGGAPGGAGGMGGRRGGATTAPAAGAFFDSLDDTLFFANAPAGPAAPGGAAAPGAPGAGMGGRAGGMGAGGPGGMGAGGAGGAGMGGRAGGMGGGGMGAGGMGGGARGGGGGAAPSAASLKAQADAYAKLFAIFEKHKNVVERVTFWGLNDRRSWRQGQSPLIFDNNNLRKPCYVSIVEQLLHPDPNLAAPK